MKIDTDREYEKEEKFKKEIKELNSKVRGLQNELNEKTETLEKELTVKNLKVMMTKTLEKKVSQLQET